MAVIEFPLCGVMNGSVRRIHHREAGREGGNGSCVPGEYVVSVSGEGGAGRDGQASERHFSAPLDSCSPP